MTQTIFVGIGAGLAAALLFLAPASGTVLAFPLFALTGLPIAIAGLGWGVVGGAIAAGVGTLGVLTLAHWAGGALFVFIFGAPLAFLARLAILSRPLGVRWRAGMVSPRSPAARRGRCGDRRPVDRRRSHRFRSSGAGA